MRLQFGDRQRYGLLVGHAHALAAGEQQLQTRRTTQQRREKLNEFSGTVRILPRQSGLYRYYIYICIYIYIYTYIATQQRREKLHKLGGIMRTRSVLHVYVDIYT